MAVLLKTASVRVSSIEIMQVRVQNKGKSVWKSIYDGDVSILAGGKYLEIKASLHLFHESTLFLGKYENQVLANTMN